MIRIAYHSAPVILCEKWCPQFTQNREQRHISAFLCDMYFPTLALSKSGSRSRLKSLLSAHLFELPIFEHYTRLTLNLQASKSSKYIISIQRESTGIRTLRNCQPAVFIKITVRIHLAGPVKKNQITVHTKRRVFLQKFLKFLRHHWLTFPCQIQDHTELIFIFSKQLLLPL